MNVLAFFVMISLGVLINYILLKILTNKVYPPGKLRGRIGKRGTKGFQGERGRIGKQGPLNVNDLIVGLKGERGTRGDESRCGETNVLDDFGNLVGGCASNDNLASMDLVSYQASKKDTCLFGYQRRVFPVTYCKSPMTGTNPTEDNLLEYGIKRWAPNNSKTNCNYYPESIKKMKPAQFKIWAKLMSDRRCPGVPAKGLVPGATGGQDLSEFRNENWKSCPVVFKKCRNCNMQQSRDVCTNSMMNLASAGQVQYATKKCDPKLNSGGEINWKPGKVSDGFNVEASSDPSVGILIRSYNYGVFCVPKGAKDMAYVPDYIYGLRDDHKVWKIPTRGGRNWTKVSNSGMINQIDVYMGYIYGVGMNENEGGRIGGSSVYRMSINGGRWSKIVGCCVYQISVSDGFIYGIGLNNAVYKVSAGGGNWSKFVGGSVKHICAYKGTVYGVGMDNSVYKTVPQSCVAGTASNHYNCKDNVAKGYCSSGRCKDGYRSAYCGSGGCYCVCAIAGNRWKKITQGSVTQISIHMGKLYGLGTNGKVYVHNIDGSGAWTDTSPDGNMIMMLVNHKIFGIGSDRRPYQSDISRNGTWDVIPGFPEKVTSLQGGLNINEINVRYKYTFSLKIHDWGWAGGKGPVYIRARGSNGFIDENPTQYGGVQIVSNGTDRNRHYTKTVRYKDVGVLQSIQIFYQSTNDMAVQYIDVSRAAYGTKRQESIRRHLRWVHGKNYWQ